MNKIDLINGLFEIASSGFTLINVYRIIKDKKVQGVSVIPVIFFSSWCIWNCFFYPWNGLWLSFIGGIFIGIVNIIWVFLFFKYKSHDKNKMIDYVSVELPKCNHHELNKYTCADRGKECLECPSAEK